METIGRLWTTLPDLPLTEQLPHLGKFIGAMSNRRTTSARQVR